MFLQEQAALHDEIPYHHISISYYPPALPYIALILKGKECKASSERAQGQRAAHKGRGSHLSSVVPLHICCRLPQRVTNPLSTGPISLFLQILALVTLFDHIFWRHQLRCIVTINCFYNRAHALIGMRKMDTKWASPHFLIDTPMMPSFDGWPWNSVSLRIDLYKLPVWLQIMTNSQLMWIDGTVTSQRFTLNKQSQNTKYTPTPKQKVQ